MKKIFILFAGLSSLFGYGAAYANTITAWWYLPMLIQSIFCFFTAIFFGAGILSEYLKDKDL